MKNSSRTAAPKTTPKTTESGAAPSLVRRIPYEYPALLLALALVMLTLLEFIQNQKWLILTCSCLSVLLVGIVFFTKSRRESPRLFFLFYSLYLLWMALGVLWACSGKFILREFSKQLFCLPLTLYILFLMPEKEKAIRKLLFLMSAVGAFYAILSVDNATAGLSCSLLNLIPGFSADSTGFEAGTRLTGIFSNGNISAGLLALCIFLSLYLLESSENRRQRVFAAAFASLQAGTFLLNFSLGATGFFIISAVVYLIFAGERRISVFLRMLEIAVPVLIAVFLSFRYFEVSDGSRVIPLIAALLSAALTVLLELAVFPRLSRALNARGKLTAAVFIVVLLAVAAYASAGLLLGGEAEIAKGQSLRRSAYPSAGDYSLSLSADGNVNVRVVSQDEREVVMHTETVLFSGAANDAAFTVPEGSKVVYLTFSTSDRATLREASLLGPESIRLHLDYPLLPGFVANRLQGLMANENAIQRAAFFRDGMKIFRDHPILGAGLGCFETLLFGYQEFYYETKYVHNHYIQVLLDCGAVGLLLYLALLVLTAGALWRGRRNDGPYRSLHPALCAAFAMIVLHSIMEVVMSTSVYLPYAWTILCVAAVCYAPPLKKRSLGSVSAALSGAVAFIYAVLIILNLSANASVRKSTSNAVRFFNALERAAKTDIFEKNDWMVSYIDTCADTGSATYRAQADIYSEKLLDVPSNSLHQYLLHYYLSFRDYDHTLLAARRSIGFNYSNSKNWNSCFHILASALEEQPEDSGEILRCVRELQSDLETYQQRLMEPIQLDSASKEIINAATNE